MRPSGGSSAALATAATNTSMRPERILAIVSSVERKLCIGNAHAAQFVDQAVEFRHVGHRTDAHPIKVPAADGRLAQEGRPDAGAPQGREHTLRIALFGKCA